MSSRCGRATFSSWMLLFSDGCMASFLRWAASECVAVGFCTALPWLDAEAEKTRVSSADLPLARLLFERSPWPSTSDGLGVVLNAAAFLAGAAEADSMAGGTSSPTRAPG